MKPRIVEIKNIETKKKDFVFRDKDGRDWHPENLQDLVNAVKKLKDINETADYYF